ncbi:phage terminase small subunit [Xenorhabdus szentirmaii]|uniref:phage terminase small subunit n=1 Tax=Xenorhabdus szentirmaii TaxID=290112 RepID=UPI00199DB94F|nr:MULTISPECIES: phage terminase small subunit [unclassified Xenorhabdus]MBD2806420.1 terminase [Xenorhabdus sp. ZM]MBD2825675.1 terminase [Xenorhabdus sp. 5]
MLTPAQEHWQRVMAARRGDETMSSETLTAYEQVLHRLRIDQARLSDLQGTERKIDYKRHVIASYDGWVDGVLTADTGQADEVLTHAMIWQMDIGNYDRALDLAEYVIRHNLPLPDRYKRTVGPLLVDEICDKALTIFAADSDTLEPLPLAILERLAELVEPVDMPNQVKAKLFKTLAYTLRRSEQRSDKERALFLMQQALILFANIGVKKDIETLTRELKKAEGSSSDDTPPQNSKPAAAGKKPTQAKTKTTASKTKSSR